MRKRLTVAVTAAAALFAAGGTAAMAEETPSPSPTEAATSTELERVSAYTQPSVVYLGITWTGYVYDTFNKRYLNTQVATDSASGAKPFELKFQCTGYVVNPDGYIATAGHCVDPAEVTPAFYSAAAEWALANGYYASNTLTLDDVLGFGDYQVRDTGPGTFDPERAEGKKRPALGVQAAWSVSAGGVETGKALPARVIKWQKFDQGDGALLKVEATNLNALPLSDEEIEIGKEVVAVGYPGSVDLVADATFTPSFKEGAVSSKKTVSGGLLTVYEISAAVSGGMSGGPTVSLDSEVVGFNSFGIDSEIETQQFNFVRPVAQVNEMLGDAGTSNELSEDAQAYRAGLDAFFAGDKETAVENLESVVDNQPTHDLAKEYLEKAEDLPDAPKDDGGFPMWIIWVVVALLVLAAIVGLVLWLLSRNKKRSSETTGAPAAYGGPPPGSGPPPGYQPGPGSAPVASPGTQSTAVMDRPEQQGPSAGSPVPPAAPAPTPPPPPAAAPPAPAPTAAAPDEQETATVEQDEDVFCSNCGTKGEPGQKFCKHCGTHL